ncbi:MAG: host attachment family protein [Oceanicaulis sp.]
MRTGSDQITWVAVFDGGKALVFENKGFDDAVNLELLARFDNDNPPDREQTTDKPGRFQDAGSGSKGQGVDEGAAHGRSGVQQTDRHELEKTRFTDRLMERLASDAEHQRFDKLVLIAADKTLGEAREQYTDRLEKRLIIEEPKDVVNEPAGDIEKRVQKLLTEHAAETPAKSHMGLSGPQS